MCIHGCLFWLCTQAEFSTYHIPVFSLNLEAGALTAKLVSRDAMQVLAQLVKRVDPKSLKFIPELGPPWGEYHTGRQYTTMFKQVRRDHPDPDEDGLLCYPLGVMLMMDKTNVGRGKQVSAFPEYMAIMNQLADARYHPSSVSLLAYLPHFTSAKIKKRRDDKKLSHFRIIHHCMAIVLDSLRHFQDGVYLRTADKKIIRVVPFVAYINSDNVEQNFQCCLRLGGATYFPLRDCLMHKDLIGKVVPLMEQNGSRSSEFIPRSDATHRAAVEEVHRLIKARRHVNDGTMGKVREILDSLSIIPVKNCYWDVPMAPGGVYQSAWAELLHQLGQGIFKKMKEGFMKILEFGWKGWTATAQGDHIGGLNWAIDIIEDRMRKLPQFTDGITRINHFKKGVWALSWMSDEDHISMFQQLVGLRYVRFSVYKLALLCVEVITYV